MSKIGFLSLIAVAVALLVGCEQQAKLTVRVVDDNNQPVQGARVTVSFEHDNLPSRRTIIKGSTDNQGQFVAESRTSGDVAYWAEMTNWYVSSDGYAANDGAVYTDPSYQGPRQAPWNTTQSLILRKIDNPIPLAARTLILKVTNHVGEAGCDLLTGDWLPPFGVGTNADIVFRWSYRYGASDDREGQLTMSFPHPGDGYIMQPYSRTSGSELRMQHHAPDTGYSADARRWRVDQSPAYRNYSVPPRFASAFFFRIRTQTNSSGQITRAYFGKSDGDVQFFGAGDEGTGCELIYYLNPAPNDRNLEFDGKTNLFDTR